MDRNELLAKLEAMETLARLLQSGDVSGDQAGSLLELAIAGIKAEIEAVSD